MFINQIASLLLFFSFLIEAWKKREREKIEVEEFRKQIERSRCVSFLFSSLRAHSIRVMEIIVDNPDWIFDKPISIFSLDAADRRVLKIADRRDAIQKKTFTKWINFHLAKRNVLLVNDLFTDLRDGHLLLTLLEIFTNQTMVRSMIKEKNRVKRSFSFSRENADRQNFIR